MMQGRARGDGSSAGAFHVVSRSIYLFLSCIFHLFSPQITEYLVIELLIDWFDL
jgi:hypothetical protein